MLFPAARRSGLIILFLGTGLLSAAPAAEATAVRAPSATAAAPAAATASSNGSAATATTVGDTALFAGGSFWALEPVFETLPGVDSVVSGYAGGQGALPDFESPAGDSSGYAEAVQVFYRSRRIPYAKLLDAYWRNIDPTRADGQFSDRGAQYRTLIFYRNQAEMRTALASRARLEKSKRFAGPLVTEIVPAAAFHRAQARDQDYYRKSAVRYHGYMRFSGREAFLKKTWGGGSSRSAPSAKSLRSFGPAGKAASPGSASEPSAPAGPGAPVPAAAAE